MASLRRDSLTLFPRLSVALKYKLYLILAQSLLAFFYISFSIIFTRCSSRQQFWLLLFLPVMKLALKHLVAWLASENKETIPAVVVFTVDVFNGLYVSTCIQLSRSWWSSFLVISLNIVRTVVSLWDINRRAKTLVTLDNLSRESKMSGQSLKRTSRNRRQSVSLFQPASCPSDLQMPTTTTTVLQPQKHRQVEQTITYYETKLNLQLRKMLFYLEYLVLVGYIESIIPTLYVIYLMVLIHLPSAKYYPHTNNLTTLQLRTNIGSIMLYASVEMLSIICLHVVLRRKFGFSLLYQLAFVLETEKELLQGRLFVWITPLLQITLVHFEALERYYNNTSRFRVLSACVLTPWPALLLGILTECIPLQDPTAGWKANFGAWIRYWVFISSAAIGFLFQIRGATPEVSLQKFIMIVVGTGCGTTACLILLADVWAFPLPFGIVIISAPFQTFFVIFVLISIRQEGVTLTASINKALKHRICLILAQSALVFVYVTFSVIFAKCPPKHQFGLLLLLPVMKLVFKHLVARLAIDSTETLPVVVVFTVDLFNGLYVSICLQSSRSWWASLLMIALNIGQTLIALWDVGRGSKDLDIVNAQSSNIKSCGSVTGIFDIVKPDPTHSMSFFRSTILQNQITPSPTFDLIAKANTLAQESEHTSTKTTSKLDRGSRKMLFRLEYLVLIEYIESVVPTLYVIYLSIVFNLPSAKYYPHTRTLTLNQLQTNVGSIMLYASTEMLSLIWLHLALKRKLGFSLLYQLAFVLESEMDLVQGRLFVWILPLLQITLVHFGTSVN
ncbi:hypothetical protein PHPALM_28706 [Phytophthora palmivora]|uniref:Transmembrane protein n=1 Tax=Phytophthora palmivora TaxID=4796 RepID=A0A2P4X9E7_9STRA|nr:hypothetical protein PHPALM_28706 [Phytophthora palmivora]